jgi:cell division protein FtsI (penicillin-binding protein 3)
MPGESKGIFRFGDHPSPVSLASMSFGQEISVTALQMITAVGAIANGGLLMKPLIVRQIEDANGEIEREMQPIAVRRVIQPSTAETLTDVLKSVVREGTGRHAAIPGYTVAGKTGTAQMLDASGHYSMIDHVASFVGFVPASRPALVVLVSLERPRGVRNEGGDVAAPVFARVAAQALRRLAVPSDDPDHVLRPSADPMPLVTRASVGAETAVPVTSAGAAPNGGMPSLLGLPAREAAAVAVRHGLMVELRGSGRVVEQTPAAGAAIDAGTTCHLVLDRGARAEVPAPPAPRDPRVAQVNP